MSIKRIITVLFFCLFISCKDDGGGRYLKIWQLPSGTEGQMMSYVIEYNNKTAVIDGGNLPDADYLSSFLDGSYVDAWFITHLHYDHAEALIEILNRDLIPRIGKIYMPEADRDWIARNDQSFGIFTYDRFFSAAGRRGIAPVILNSGDIVYIDDLKFEILSAFNSELPLLNNSSLVIKIYYGDLSVMFTADLQKEGGAKMLAAAPEKLKSDVLQVAHHGNTDINYDFFQAVKPVICLWPSTEKLWNNDNGGGFNTGTYQTVTVRDYMTGLGVKENMVQYEGLQCLELYRDSPDNWYRIVKY